MIDWKKEMGNYLPKYLYISHGIGIREKHEQNL